MNIKIKRGSYNFFLYFFLIINIYLVISIYLLRVFNEFQKVVHVVSSGRASAERDRDKGAVVECELCVVILSVHDVLLKVLGRDVRLPQEGKLDLEVGLDAVQVRGVGEVVLVAEDVHRKTLLDNVVVRKNVIQEPLNVNHIKNSK